MQASLQAKQAKRIKAVTVWLSLSLLLILVYAYMHLRSSADRPKLGRSAELTHVYSARTYISDVSCHSACWGQASLSSLQLPDNFVLLILKHSSLPVAYPVHSSSHGWHRPPPPKIDGLSIMWHCHSFCYWTSHAVQQTFHDTLLVGRSYPVLRCLLKHCGFHTTCTECAITCAEVHM